MVDEPETGEIDDKTMMDKLKPAAKLVLAVVAVFAIVLIFHVIMLVSFYYLRDQGIFRLNSYGQYPLYDAFYYFCYGGLLLLISGFFVTSKDWHDVLINKLQLAPNRQKVVYFLIGLITGAAGIVLVNVLSSVIAGHLYQGKLFIELRPDMLADTALLALPLLMLSVGLVALLQGYFQRTVADRYDPVVGIFAAAFLYMLWSINIRDIIGWLIYPQLWLQFLFIGAIIACLYYYSKTLYMPIGFTFAWYLFDRVYAGLATAIPLFPATEFLGVSAELGLWYIRTLVVLAILLAVWIIGSRSSLFSGGRLGKLKMAAAGIISRFTRD